MLNRHYLTYLSHDEVGKNFFADCLDALKKGNFLICQKYLSEALNLITCDCILGRYMFISERGKVQVVHTFKDSVERMVGAGTYFKDSHSKYPQKNELLFCKAYFYLFTKSRNVLEEGLQSINEYLTDDQMRVQADSTLHKRAIVS